MVRNTSSIDEPPVGEVTREIFESFHKHPLRGIHVPWGEKAAFSIRFRIGPGATYPNEWINENKELSYSGQGKPEDGDQVWNRDNNGLRISMEEKLPVMVFQTIPGKPPRYIYHGRWFVTNYDQRIVEKTGQKVFRFTISESLNRTATPLGGLESFNAGGAIDLGKPPARVNATVSRIVRDTDLSKKLKQKYRCKCQVCGKTLTIRGQPYAEAHHLKPLGGEHNGHDTEANMLVLCPNDHALFDMLEIAIDPTNGKSIINSLNEKIGMLSFLPEHVIEPEWIEYHYERFLNIRKME